MKTSETVSQKKSFRLLKLSVSGIFHSDLKLINKGLILFISTLASKMKMTAYIGNVQAWSCVGKCICYKIAHA
jgi:hypothetical protein